MYLKIPLSAPHPDDAKRERLIAAIVDAHMRAAYNNAHNASSAAFCNAWANTRNVQAAIASAVLTTGSTHAPVTVARFVYDQFTEHEVRESIEQESPVVGFGNSFFKDRIDPSWSLVVHEIDANWPAIKARIQTLEDWVAKYRPGKPKLLPNAALFTGAACSECQLPSGTELSILYAARIHSWVSMIPR